MKTVVSIGRLESGRLAIIRLEDRKILSKHNSISVALEVANQERYDVINRTELEAILTKRAEMQS